MTWHFQGKENLASKIDNENFDFKTLQRGDVTTYRQIFKMLCCEVIRHLNLYKYNGPDSLVCKATAYGQDDEDSISCRGRDASRFSLHPLPDRV